MSEQFPKWSMKYAPLHKAIISLNEKIRLKELFDDHIYKTPLFT